MKAFILGLIGLAVIMSQVIPTKMSDYDLCVQIAEKYESQTAKDICEETEEGDYDHEEMEEVLSEGRE